MEKEMKKLLLVAVSVGVFLLVTITISIIILTPKTQPLDNAVSSYSQGRVQPAVNYLSDPPAGQENPAPNTQANNAALDSNDGDNLTIQIPIPTAAAVPETPAPTSTAPIRVSSTTTASTTPAATQTTTAPAAVPVAAAVNTTAAARTVTARTVIDYWIQIGAYSAMVRAEDVREFLAAKGLITIIENREVSGDNLYRVRLGPYTSEREANHWLAIVQAIDGFSDSQVRQTTRQQ